MVLLTDTSEMMILFFCAFLALRYEDTKAPVNGIKDHAIHRERELLAGEKAASPLLNEDSRYADVSSMMGTSMRSNCFKKERPESLDSKLRFEVVSLKGMKRETIILSITVLTD